MKSKMTVLRVVFISLLITCIMGSSVFADEVLEDKYTYSFSEQTDSIKETMSIYDYDLGTETKEYDVILVPKGAQIEFTPTIDLGATISVLYEYDGEYEASYDGLPWVIDGELLLVNGVGANKTATATFEDLNYYIFSIYNYENSNSTKIMIKVVEDVKEVTSNGEPSEEATAPSVETTQETSDMPDGWAKDEVESSISLGLVPSYIQNNYKENITRDEFCNLVTKLVEVKTGKSIDTIISERELDTLENPFTDTDKEWIINANRLGIVNGRGNGVFDPNGSITRQEAAVMLANTAKVLDIKIESTGGEFADDDHIASWAKDSVGFVSSRGVMNGVGNSMFSPKSTYTRQQAFVTTLRLFDSLK